VIYHKADVAMILFKADVAMIKRTYLTIDTDEEKTISKDRQEGRIV